MFRFLKLIILSIPLIFTFNLNATAATFVVTQFDDPAPIPAPNGCNTGGSCSLREATLAANALPDPDTIQLSAGTYNLSIAEGGTPETGDLDLTGPVVIQGAGQTDTIINGVQPGLADRLIQIGPPGASIDVEILSLTLQGGIAPGGGGGGGVNVNSLLSRLSLSDCRVINNQASGGGALGGGIYNSGELIIDNCQIDNNTAVNAGGGIFSGGLGSLSILSTSVSGNTLSSSGSGGGIFYAGPGGLLISDSQINNNRIPNGAGIGGGVVCDASGLPVNILNSTISGNTLPAGGSGGGIYCAGSLNFDQVLISNNQISTSGTAGGAYLVGIPSLFINNSTISGNQVTGIGGMGGLFITGTSTIINNSTINNNFGDLGIGGLSSTVTLFEMTNSTVTGNQTNGNGGGVYIDADNASINNCSIVGNQADLDGSGGGFGGGIFNGDGINPSTITLRNTILAQNTDDGTAPDCFTAAFATFTSAGYNLIGTDVGCTIIPPQGDPASTDLYGVDPMLNALADNGGPTQTMALQQGSPALDGGNPGGCTDGVGTLLDQDQRGQVRPAGGRCDIGAFELGDADLEVVKTASAPGAVTGAEISYTVTVTNNGPDDSFNVTLTDTLPAEVTLVSFDSADADCTEAGGTITCLVLELAAGEGFTVTIVVTMDEEGEIENTATVTGSDIDPDPANNSSTATVNVIQSFFSGSGCALAAHSHHSSKSLGLGMAALLAAFYLLRKKIKVHSQ